MHTCTISMRDIKAISYGDKLLIRQKSWTAVFIRILSRRSVKRSLTCSDNCISIIDKGLGSARGFKVTAVKWGG